MKTMTTREFYNAVILANVSDEITEKAQELIAALDKKNDNRKARGTKTQQENVEVKANILNNMEYGTVYTAKEIAKINDLSSSQKASALLSQLVESGDLEKETVKTKSGKLAGYKLVENSVVEAKSSKSSKTENE